MSRSGPLALLLLLVLAPRPALGAPEAWPTAAWTLTSPEAQGLDSATLAGMLSFLHEQGTSIHGIVVTRHGRLVLEAYGGGYGPDRPYEVKDVANAVISILVGMAIADGRLGLDQELPTLFPDAGPGLQGVTVRQLLTMSSGLGAPREAPAGDGAAWTRALLETRRVQAAGAFYQNEVNASLAQAVVARATGTPAAAFARARLFEPLGIRNYAFGGDPKSPSGGPRRLLITPRDLAKVGYLYLRKGVWEGRPLVPAAWVEESTRKQIDSSNQNLNIYLRGPAYGYLWWVDEGGAYSAASAPGEYLLVVPEADLVAVFTGNLYCDRRLARELMKTYVLPAIRGEGPLPENPAAQAALAARARELE
jgi:CubicO group peptidase (beta-lactamase class C family)